MSFRFAILILMIISSGFSFTACDFILQQHSEPEAVAITSPQPAVFRIISPAFADVNYKSENMLINWTASANIREVNIFLYKKDELIEVISENSENSGQFIWRIPVNIGSSVQYSIKIENSADEKEFGLSNRFEIRD